MISFWGLDGEGTPDAMLVTLFVLETLSNVPDDRGVEFEVAVDDIVTVIVEEKCKSVNSRRDPGPLSIP